MKSIIQWLETLNEENLRDITPGIHIPSTGFCYTPMDIKWPQWNLPMYKRYLLINT